MTEEKENIFSITPLHKEPVAALASSESGSKKQTTGPKTDNRRSRSGKQRHWLKPVVRQIRVLKPESGAEKKERVADKSGGLKIIHFGGLGEVGRNMSAIQYDDEIILIDCGVSFPNEDMPGIDFIIPNAGYLEDKQEMIKAIFFTHSKKGERVSEGTGLHAFSAFIMFKIFFIMSLFEF